MSDETKKEPPQIDRFREKARELECDDDETAFEAVVRKIAKTPAKLAKKAKKKKAR